jgi:outer membrane protein
MVSRLTGLAAILLLVIPHLAAAQNPLPLDQAVATALRNNAALRAAAAGVQESAARADEARAAYLPRVDYSETWQRGNNPVYVFGTLLGQQRFTAADFDLRRLNTPDDLANHRGAFTIEQPVFDSARLHGMRSAGVGRRIAGEMEAEARADIAVGVTRTYGSVLLASAARKAADAAVETAKDDLARARQRRDAGLVTEADVLSIEVFLAQTQERQIRATSNEFIARAQLNQLMGTPLDQSFLLMIPEPRTPLPASLADDEAQAVASRPAVRRAEAQVALAGVGRSAARSALLPQVSIQGVYELNGHSFTDRASSWLVAGQLRFNLFAGLGDAARLRAAAAAEARATAEREQAVTSVRVEVRAARAELAAAVARQAVGRAAVLQARESQRIIRDRYESGLAPVGDVLRAATALLDADTQRTASIVDVMIGQAALDRAAGRLR